MKKSIKNGFTMIDALMGMLITSVICLCIVVYMRTCLGCLRLRINHQDQMAILQIRELAAVSTNLCVKDNKLNMVYENQEIELSYDKNRIVRKKGYEIFMENVEYAYFVEESESIYLVYEKDKNKYKMQIY